MVCWNNHLSFSVKFRSFFFLLAYHMKCIDPWLVNSRRQCPVCKRYVFPNQDHSDDEENNNNNRQQPRTPTEQTPLMNPNNDNSDADASGNRQSPGKCPTQ